ncbi:MAG: metallopeptidase family protein [Candidatus Limnocylindrales bacterium]
MTYDDALGADFEALVERALDELPDEFRSRLESVAIVIDEEAPAETLRRMRVHGLYGLYEGVPRTAWGADNAPIPSKITIFRRPLEAYNPSPAALARAVRDTVFHEIAHHFGISDARLDELSREAGPRRNPR